MNCCSTSNNAWPGTSWLVTLISVDQRSWAVKYSPYAHLLGCLRLLWPQWSRSSSGIPSRVSDPRARTGSAWIYRGSETEGRSRWRFGGAKTAAKQATCDWCWYWQGFCGNFLVGGSRKIWGSGFSPLGFARLKYSLLLSHSENGAVSLICRAP